MPLNEFLPIELLQDLGLEPYAPVLIFLAAWLLLGVLALLLPVRRRLAFYLVLSVALQLGIRGTAFWAWLAGDLLVYLFAVWVARSEWRFAPRFRWNCCCAAMVLVATTTLAGRALAWGRFGPTLAGMKWPLFVLDLYQGTLLVTFLWEFGSQKIKLPPLGDFLLWRNLPLTVVFVRYSELHRQLPRMAQPPRFAEVVNRKTVLLFLLAVVQVLLGGLCHQMQELLFHDGPVPLWGKFGFFFLWGPWTFYFLTAGLSNAYLASGTALGMHVPVNFDNPFFRTNISEFWKCWNITLTSIWRDYFFYNRWGFKQPNLYVNTMLLFLAMGAWHGLNLYWLMFGVLHGLGFCVYMWYRQLKARHPGRFEIPGRTGKVLSWAITYGFVCSCWAVPSQLARLVPGF